MQSPMKMLEWASLIQQTARVGFPGVPDPQTTAFLQDAFQKLGQKCDNHADVKAYGQEPSQKRQRGGKRQFSS